LQNILKTLSDSLGDLSGNIFSLLPLAAVIFMLVIAHRILNRQAQQVAGRRFRNQMIMAGISFVGILVFIIMLPLDGGVRGQLLTLVGIIISVTISLSSSTFLGNAMAGIMLKSVRNFRSGDFVQVGDHFGRVTERGLFHTEIQTATRDLTTLPNLYLATTPVTVVRSSGTIVDATVSLGFDIPHGRIEALLMEAGEKAELKEPFVQVMELGDYSVTYRVAGLLEDTKRLLTFRSRLRVAMLDCLHRDGVEIVSPNFMNVRDYNTQHEFVPPTTVAAPPNTADAPPDVVFDKAEEAETISDLHQTVKDLAENIEQLQGEIKKASGDDKQKLQQDIARAEQQLEERQAEISAAEARDKSKDS